MKDHRESFDGSYALLRDAGIKLARAVTELEPNPDFAPTAPSVYAVGGFVRDTMLGLKPKDMDVEVYGVAPADLHRLLETLFGRVGTVGEAFGILKVHIGDDLDMDVSIPRRESKAGVGHQGFLVASDPSLDVKEAARRRDFTMNAMAYDLSRGVIFDPFGGLKDVRNRVLRVTDEERFQDDPLRVLRAVQFAARFGLSVEPQSFQLMREMVERGDLMELSNERITDEWRKLLLKSERPSVGLELMRSLGIVEKLYPELHVLNGVAQEPEWHPEGDVWIHTCMVMDQAARIIRREDFTPEEMETVMLGALCHDFGKPSTTERLNDRIRSLRHEEAGEEPTRAFLARLRVSNAVEHGVVACVKDHLKPTAFFLELERGHLNPQSYANALRKVLKRLAPTSWRVLLAVAEADSRGRAIPGVETNPYVSGEAWAAAVQDAALDKAPTLTLIQGRDVLDEAVRKGLSRRPGKWVGEAIGAIEALRDEGKIETHEQALEALRLFKF